jgi:SAM-dependent methyltransferase
MSLNHAFILNQVRRHAGEGAALLDFGCGQGELVALARRQGFSASGCDWYSGPWAWLFDDVMKNPQLRACIRRIEPSGRVPFDDGSFDAVTSNMVFEHIADFRGPVSEIARVLKPGGHFIALFPSRELWFEQHVGLPFAHRFAPGSRAQRHYFSLAHRLGMGWRREGLSRDAWAERSIVALRDEVAYRPAREAEDLFRREFEVVDRAEAGWIRDRVAHSRLKPLAPLIAPSVFDPVLRYLGSRLATLAFVLRKRF